MGRSPHRLHAARADPSGKGSYRKKTSGNYSSDSRKGRHTHGGGDVARGGDVADAGQGEGAGGGDAADAAQGQDTHGGGD